eukprot:GHVQ01038093.1.p1 GENE.GHVQ01038093.1~~GHVQ01038093.1.p1  ORF type:complete len:643 (+),score=54.64 GHVQ01038093.1:307-2235(+)
MRPLAMSSWIQSAVASWFNTEKRREICCDDITSKRSGHDNHQCRDSNKSAATSHPPALHLDKATNSNSTSFLSRRYLVTFALMFLNFATSVSIIWCNKLAYNAGFRWPMALTTIHFCFTFVGILLCAQFGLFALKTIDAFRVLPISAAFCGFVVFNNLSLQLNSVGVYQLLKVMTTPCIVVLQFFLYSQRLPIMQMISLVPICLGVSLATGTSGDMNVMGLVFGVAGILSTSLYQIWVKREQDALKCTSSQLLAYQAPLSGVMLLFLIPYFEPLWAPTNSTAVSALLSATNVSQASHDWQLPAYPTNESPSSDVLDLAAARASSGLRSSASGQSAMRMEGYGGERLLSSSQEVHDAISDTIEPGLLEFQWGLAVTFWVLASAVLSFLVNLSIFLVIRRTSALSYNVLGHGKLCTILISGYLFFDSEKPATASVIGVLLTVVGIVWYTHLKLQPPKEVTSSGSVSAEVTQHIEMRQNQTPIIKPSHQSSTDMGPMDSHMTRGRSSLGTSSAAHVDAGKQISNISCRASSPVSTSALSCVQRSRQQQLQPVDPGSVGVSSAELTSCNLPNSHPDTSKDARGTELTTNCSERSVLGSWLPQNDQHHGSCPTSFLSTFPVDDRQHGAASEVHRLSCLQVGGPKGDV